MAKYPNYLELRYLIRAGDLAAAARITLDALQKAGLLPVKLIPDPSNASALVEFSDSSFGGIRSDEDGQRWIVELQAMLRSEQVERMQQIFESAVEAARNILRTGQLESSHIARVGPGLKCIPFVPIAKTYQLVVTDDAEVKGAYEDATVFWKAGWNFDERQGTKQMLIRGEGLTGNVTYLAAIIEHQWDMARAAKPGLTKYYAPQVMAEELPVFQSGEPCLSPVAHIAEGNIVEYAGFVPPGQHVRGWEVFELDALLCAKALPDGLPVDAVRVVFFSREMAESEKRPLLDIGAELYFQGEAGHIIRIK